MSGTFQKKLEKEDRQKVYDMAYKRGLRKGLSKKQVIKLIKDIMPGPDRTFDTPDEVVYEMWLNIQRVEEQMYINGEEE